MWDAQSMESHVGDDRAPDHLHIPARAHIDWCRAGRSSCWALREKAGDLTCRAGCIQGSGAAAPLQCALSS